VRRTGIAAEFGLDRLHDAARAGEAIQALVSTPTVRELLSDGEFEQTGQARTRLPNLARNRLLNASPSQAE
jgi:hypothetical protein